MSTASIRVSSGGRMGSMAGESSPPKAAEILSQGSGISESSAWEIKGPSLLSHGSSILRWVSLVDASEPSALAELAGGPFARTPNLALPVSKAAGDQQVNPSSTSSSRSDQAHLQQMHAILARAPTCGTEQEISCHRPARVR